MIKKLILKIGFRQEIPKERFILDYHIHPTAVLYKSENVHISTSALICEYVIIRAPVAKLYIGDNTQIGPFTVIFTSDNIYIGSNVMIAPHCVIASGTHDYSNVKVPMIEAAGISKGPIYIEDDVWIGANCTIIDNVKIAKGAVIAANSLVNKNVGEYEIVGGVPAKFIKSRK